MGNPSIYDLHGNVENSYLELDVTLQLTTLTMLSLMKIIHWAITWWYPSVENAKLISEWWSLKIQMWYSTRGFLWTISHIKAIRLHITRYICGEPLLTPQGSLSLRKDGLPKGISPLLDVLGTNQGKSFVLTLLNISRCLPGTKEPDLSTITSPWEGYIPFQIKEFIPEFVKMYNFPKYESNFTLSELINSNKSGPIGVTTPTSVLQVNQIPDKMKDELVQLTGGYPEPLNIMGRIVPNIPPILKPISKWAPATEKWFGILCQAFHARRPEFVTYLRKLSIVNDPEGKARIICIFDYWSQMALKGVHSYGFNLLRLIPQDRTFDQNPFMIKKEGPYYSIDLTAATDRFPLELQKLLLQELSSETVARAWSSILTDYEVYVPWENRTVKYCAGQPMGAYSSWAIFALTHHLIVQYSAKAVGETTPFKDYMLLGDDIVIANKAVSDKYCEILSILGVGISTNKTHASQHTYEFAKRWISHGHEISGIPLRGLLSSWKKYHLLVPMIYSIVERVPARQYNNVPGLLYDLHVTMGTHIKQAKSLVNRAAEFSAIWKYMKTGNTDEILFLIKKSDTSWFPFPNTDTVDAKEYLDWLIERTLIREIMQRNEDTKGFLIGFQKRMNQFFAEVSVNQGDEFYNDVYPLMPYHPVWQSTLAESGRVNERLTEIINRKAWRELLEIVTIPDPTMIFQDRSNVKVSQGVAKFAKDLFKTAMMQRKKDVWFSEQFD